MKRSRASRYTPSLDSRTVAAQQCAAADATAAVCFASCLALRAVSRLSYSVRPQGERFCCQQPLGGEAHAMWQTYQYCNWSHCWKLPLATAAWGASLGNSPRAFIFPGMGFTGGLAGAKATPACGLTMRCIRRHRRQWLSVFSWLCLRCRG